MTASRVARRYAKALFKVALEEKKLEAYKGELEAFFGQMKSEPMFSLALSSPFIPLQSRISLLDEVARTLGLSEVVKKLLGLMVERNRIRLLDEVLRAYGDLVDRYMGRSKGVLRVPFEPPRDYVERIAQALSNLTGKKVTLEVLIDPSLIGGAKAEVEGVVYDGSVMAQLMQLRKTLLEG